MARSPVVPSPLLQGLVEYWQLEESSGNRLGAVSGTVLTPIAPLPTSGPGKLGQGAVFGGTSRSALSLSTDLASASGFDPKLGSFSVAAWVNLAAFNNLDRGIFGRWNNNLNNSWLLYYINSGNHFRFLLQDPTGLVNAIATSTETPLSGQWYHVVGVWNAQAQTVALYVNGRLSNSAAAPTPFASGGIASPTNANLQVGNWAANASGSTNGTIDGVGYWNRVLSPTDVALLYNRGNGLEYPFVRPPVVPASLITGLAEYWRLDETSGNRVGSVSGTLLAPAGSPLPGAATGKLGNGSAFTGVSGQGLTLSPAASALFSPGLGSFTVGCWFYAQNATANRGLVSKYTSSNADGSEEWLLYVAAAAKLGFQILTAPGHDDGSANTVFTQVTATDAIISGQWYFVLGWYDPAAATVNLQVNNGAPVTVAANAAFATGGIGHGTQSLRVGSWTNGTSLSGTIDGVFYYNRVLSPTERALLWSNGNGLEYPFSRAPVTSTQTRSPVTGTTRTIAASSTLLSGLVDYWPLDEGSGFRVGVNGTTLAPSGTTLPTSTPGKLRNAFQATSASSQRLVLFPSSSSKFSPGLGSFTICCWVKPTSFPNSGRRSIICKELNGQGDWGLRQVATAYQWFVAEDAAGSFFTAQSVTASTTGQWQFLVVGFDAGAQKTFMSLNGAAPTTLTAHTAFATGGVAQGTANFNVGAENAGTNATGQNFFDGGIDGVGYWSRVLSVTEIQLLWNNGNGLSYPWQ